MAHKPILVLIADDELPARERMRTLLERYPDLEIIAEAKNGNEVIQFCGDNPVDLVFLDIQMPGLTGLDVADLLNRDQIHFIFVSAYGEHALEAFDLQACDYLTKPVRPSRLDQAVERARHLFGAAEEKSQLAGRIALPLGKKTVLLNEADLVGATVFDGSMELWAMDKSYFLAWTLKNLEDALHDGHSFFKANRQTLVNLQFLESVEYATSTLKLKNGQTIDLSRSAAKNLREILK